MKQLTYSANYNDAFKRNSGGVLDKVPMFTNTFQQSIKGGAPSNVKYYSGIDAEIYFEDVYIDETVQFQFTVQQNVMPITGYNSYVYDDVAVGARLIQGQFAINFTKAEYLMEVLNTLKTSGHASSINSQSIVSPEELTYTEKLEENKKKADNSDTTIDPILQWRRSPLWNYGFNLVINYGGYLNGAVGGTLLVLDGVYITSCTQGLAASGEPITEIYSFIARDMQFVPATISDMKPKTTVPVNTTKSANYGMSITSASYNEEVTKKAKQGVTYYDWMEYGRTGDESKVYATENTPYLTTQFNFANIPVKNLQYIRVFLDVPVQSSDAARMASDIDISSIQDGKIKTMLSQDVIEDIHSYEVTVMAGGKARNFNAAYTIIFNDDSGKQQTIQLKTEVTITHIDM